MREIPKHCWLLPLLFFAFLLSQVGAVSVFPAGPFSAWMILACLDVSLRLAPGPRFERGRLVLWGAGAFYFSGMAGAPLLGAILVILPAFLWLERKKGPLGPMLFWALGIALLFQIPRAEMLHEMKFLWMIRWAGMIYFFRILAWAQWRQPLSFFQTMEYFLSPSFLLFPLNAGFLTPAQFFESTAVESKHFRWIFRGLAFAFATWLISRFLTEWISRNYLIRSWESLAVVPVLALYFYASFAKISYLSAGFLSLAGHRVEPDFSFRGRAVSLLDFFAQAHSWVLNYFQQIILNLNFPFKGKKLCLAFGFLFLLFCPFLDPLMAISFSLLVFVLIGIGEWLKRWAWLGIGFTYFCLGVLLWLAYPIFFLQWGFPQILQFWRG